MSKKELKKYLNQLSKEQLQEQIEDLYMRFKQVKTFYNFVFEPKEHKLLAEAKFKISKEYFPLNSRKPKMRRSVAQKLITNYIQLGVDPMVIADIMFYNIEIAQQFCAEKPIKQIAFYKSMHKSFTEALDFITASGIEKDFIQRKHQIIENAQIQGWENAEAFVSCAEA